MNYEVTDKARVKLLRGRRHHWLLCYADSVAEINDTALEFFKAVIRHNNSDAAIAALPSIVDVEKDEIKRHFIAFLRELERLGICKIDEHANQPNFAQERNLQDLTSSWTNHLRHPVYLAWHLTAQCNLNCQFCYSRHRTGTLPYGDSIRCAESLIRSGVVSVSFGGGESLLVPYFVDIAKRLSSAGVQVSLVTNGTLDQEKYLLPAMAVPYKAIGVSLDSATAVGHDIIRGQGAFEKAVATARRIVTAGQHLRIVSALTTRNADEATDLVRLAASLGAEEIQFKQLKRVQSNRHAVEEFDVTMPRKVEIWKQLMELQSSISSPRIDIGTDSDPVVNYYCGDGKLLSCGCGLISACLRENGDLTACSYTDVVLGNLLQEDLEVIWRKSAAKRRRIQCPEKNEQILAKSTKAG